MSPTTRVRKSTNQASRSGVSANIITRSQSSRATLAAAILNNAIANASTSSGVVPTRRMTSSRSLTANSGRHQRLRGQSSITQTLPVSATQRETSREGHVELNTPRTPENDQTSVQLVDLITPVQPTIPAARARRPLEVDLTCDLDDEVFVVLEDIVNPSRRPNLSDLPIMLGSSPPRARLLGPRNLRSTPASRQALSRNQTFPVEPTTISLSPSFQQEGLLQIQCPICLDSLSQVKQANQQMHSTICGHLFCGPCIRKVIASTQQCPTCRQKLDIRKIHPIFI
ncbi:uncharacterized protein LOC116929767 [Daphnia magna]|uniref:RING-type domain-containing protein n=1 Tax=Daphnia magna TaxID=35525 RepID=A0A162PHY1_9CRUS|nr:uncharacterized protein LOC116929767 [Daphnia magna]KZS18863.1 Uncharacterized protein APZ42_015472 [Daphnia magna]